MLGENILVVAVDGLRAAALGAYGNTSFPTPALDQFAAESIVFDWCYVDAVDLPKIYRGLWPSRPSLLRTLADRGYTTTLVTDDPAVMELEQTADFNECVQLSAVEPMRANDASQTAFARLFAAACDQIAEDEAERPQFVWVHARGLYGPWDAPLELQEQLLAREEGDPPPEDVLEPPDIQLIDATDPDLAFRWSCAYAAQVMVLDACFEGLLRTIEEGPQRGKWLVILCGVRGLPLGEHGRVGGIDGRLFAEQLHVPLICCFPDGRDRLSRSASLVSLADLPTALLGDPRDGFVVPQRDALVATGPAGIRAARTTDWSLRQDPAAASIASRDELCCELYVRPDDRWEANNVAALCPEEAAALLARLDEGLARTSD
jgi:arylsulfatase A-like enzyme